MSTTAEPKSTEETKQVQDNEPSLQEVMTNLLRDIKSAYLKEVDTLTWGSHYLTTKPKPGIDDVIYKRINPFMGMLLKIPMHELKNDTSIQQGILSILQAIAEKNAYKDFYLVLDQFVRHNVLHNYT